MGADAHRYRLWFGRDHQGLQVSIPHPDTGGLRRLADLHR